MTARKGQVEAVMERMIEDAQKRVAALEKAHKEDAKHNKREFFPLTAEQKRGVVREVWDATDTEALIRAAVEDVASAVGAA